MSVLKLYKMIGSGALDQRELPRLYEAGTMRLDADDIACAASIIRQDEAALAEHVRDFELVLRDAHGQGMSLRQIAKAAGLSHQRVHQIVSS